MSGELPVVLLPIGLLKEYASGQERLNVPDRGRTVSELLAETGIPSALVAIVTIEGRQVMKDHVPRAGDVVRLIPLMGGG